VRGWLSQRIDWLTDALADVLTDAEQPIALPSAAAVAAFRQVLLVTAGAGDRRRQAAKRTCRTSRHRTGVLS
jgi:hypothetical protein